MWSRTWSRLGFLLVHPPIEPVHRCLEPLIEPAFHARRRPLLDLLVRRPRVPAGFPEHVVPECGAALRRSHADPQPRPVAVSERLLDALEPAVAAARAPGPQAQP